MRMVAFACARGQCRHSCSVWHSWCAGLSYRLAHTCAVARPHSAPAPCHHLQVTQSPCTDAVSGERKQWADLFQCVLADPHVYWISLTSLILPSWRLAPSSSHLIPACEAAVVHRMLNHLPQPCMYDPTGKTLFCSTPSPHEFWIPMH